MAWLPSLISLLIGILGQVNAAEWVASHPQVAMGLATLGQLITALMKSPIQGADAKAPVAGRPFLFTLFLSGALVAALASCAPAYALMC